MRRRARGHAVPARARGPAHGDRRVELGRPLRPHGGGLRPRRRSLGDLGGPSRRPGDRLLPPREAPQPRGAPGHGLRDRVLPGVGRRRLGGGGARGGRPPPLSGHPVSGRLARRYMGPMPPSLPPARGPLGAPVIDRLGRPPHAVPPGPAPPAAPLDDEDLQLTLYVLYELHYQGFAGVDDAWEWEPSLLAERARLERAFEEAVQAVVGTPRRGAGETV